MCKEVERVLAEGILMDPRCEVTMDGKTSVSDDFVCVLAHENGDAGIFYNTDALTLGMAMRMITRAFVKSMEDIPEEDRKEVADILGGGFKADDDDE